jgi:hypothetical protein
MERKSDTYRTNSREDGSKNCVGVSYVKEKK